MKLNLKNYLPLFSLIIFSCSKENVNENTLSTVKNIDMCTEINYSTNLGHKAHASSVKNLQWSNGTNIKIKFLNGSLDLQNKVKQAASEWLNYANLNFTYVNSNENADVKITFFGLDGKDTGSWSYIGTDCKYFNQNTASMNFGNQIMGNPESVRRVVLHEFGHMLGLIHEHQNPTANIQWNKEAVYSYYSNWTKEMVDINIFKKYDINITNYTNFDNKSIMLYPIDKTLTTNGYSVGWNTTLSPTDISFIQKIYPGAINKLSLYRYFINNSHLYTSNFNELGTKGYEGVLGTIFKDKQTDTYPIYRYFNKQNGDRLSTINFNELGYGNSNWIYEGISGYTYNSNKIGTKPVYRYFRSGTYTGHFYTTDYNEIGSGNYGFKYEGIAFYVMK
jgi:predicted Zn-dependent protease